MSRRESTQEACEYLGRILAAQMPKRTSFALLLFSLPDEDETDATLVCVSDTEGARLAQALRVALAQVLTDSPNGRSHA